MSAHRDPDTVADYCRNARMRGLRVIIAGAGLSAALPGVAAAHSDLPVIGVPLSSRLSAMGGLDAILSIVQMPPGVPVACVGLDNARTRATWPRILGGGVAPSRIREAAPAARRREPLHAAPTLGAPSGPTRRAWRRGGASRWRRARRWTGRRRGDLEAIRGATFTVEAVKERERVTDHDVAAFVDVLQAERRPGRALDPLRADLLRRARHRAGPAAAGGRRDRRGRRARARRGAGRAGARARRHRLRRAHPRRPRRADDLRPQARRLRLRGAPQRRAPRARVRAGERRGDQRRGRHLLGHEPGVRGARAGAAGPRARGGVDAGRPARPPRRAAAGDRAGGRRASSAWPPRSATCSAPRCARPRSRSAPARRARARCPTSATRSRPSASPGWRACCAATPRPRVENVALWHERDISHSGAERVILPDSTILLDYLQHLALRVVAAWSCTPTACARTST